ncbi:N-carbamoylsarcosine amidase, putative [Talaromyces stipitatus ATCC 10500]|uniref:N-carbamoylsarcosine amidase, putative n=1 Tax=Talaromyces stipitatus (strain ATCC 10500 / CBS 375.48 / QM 6759 / NRRL 1006) TaxID=441959 RepID=B8LUZ7_TALSN|nr:N-carbamoylsarcosine amidase, putative [Talaromyces stipitatus ATCC 10500]EED22618.1 N-carbamoylsarcosine amidase, putative [Talaromyces stipitatus ATCC 10500]
MSTLSPSDYPAYAANISNKTQDPLDWGLRPALLILDVSKAYFSEASPLSLLSSTCGTAATLPANVSRLINAARSGECPVIWARTLFTNTKLHDAGIWTRKMPRQLLQGFSSKNEDGLHEFLEGMTPSAGSDGDSQKRLADLVIEKKFVSAFFGTNLAGQLAMIGVDTIVFCGARTGGEIRQSILDAQGLGFRGIVAADACADTCKETHFANLFDIQAKMGDVLTTDMAIEGLSKGWLWQASN